jgi:rod shape-determining protein MreC
MVALALLLTIAGQVRVLNPVQGVFLSITAPVDHLLGGIFRPIATFLSDAGNLNELQDENRRLRVENESLRNRVTELESDEQLLKELQQALKVTQGATSGTRVAASVVHRDASPFSDVISIDRGSNSGIKSGMVVLSAQGSLMGTVTKTTGDQSFVRLLTDGRSKVAAQVQDSRADGIVRGSANRTLTFELSQAEIKAGDTIVTSGLGGNYPPGIPVARVTEASGTSQDLYRKVTLEPLVRFSTVRTVLVLTSFTPQRPGLEGK